jgi:hypothetical protein
VRGERRAVKVMGGGWRGGGGRCGESESSESEEEELSQRSGMPFRRARLMASYSSVGWVELVHCAEVRGRAGGVLTEAAGGGVCRCNE